MATPPEDGPPRRSADPLRLITSIGSPIALASALLLYFGWVRSEAQARAFGADASIFEMSPQDLVLRSIDILFFPIILLLLGWLLLLRLEPILRQRASVAAPVLRRAWLLLVPGLALFAVAPSVADVILPLWVLLAIGGTAYGNLLRRREDDPLDTAPLPVLALVGALIVVSLFWQTERLARLGGEALAQDIKSNVAERLPGVLLFSTGRLHVDAPGVTETTLTGEDSAYGYCYEGLYLLQRSGGKHFLLTAGWNAGQGRLVSIADTETIRLEYGPGGRCPR